MPDIKTELQQLGQEIEKAKREEAQFQGKLEEIMSRLRNEFNCRAMGDVRKKIDDLTKNVEKLDASITEKFQNLKATYEW